MLSITYNVKIITPVIMGGADSKQLDQIRPTEIKGMMRYWFRSIIGSTLKDDIEELQRIENMFFGSTDIRSPFKLIVNPINLNIGEFKRESSKYLGFSFNFKKQYKNETVKVILPESSFEVNFLFFQTKNLKNVIKAAVLPFYISTALGGFGLRSRRGFGN